MKEKTKDNRKKDVLHDQRLLEAEQEQDFHKNMLQYGLAATEPLRSGNFAEYEQLQDQAFTQTLLDYVAFDLDVLKLYIASHISECAISLSQAGIPSNITENHKKETFIAITQATSAEELKDISADFIRRMKKEYDRYNLHSYSYTIQRAVEYIHTQKYQPLSPSDVAHHLGVERTGLSKNFHREVGMTLTDYIHTMKMDIAESLISGRTYSLLEISDMLGYSSYRYFSKVYKKYKHCLPSETASRLT